MNGIVRFGVVASSALAVIGCGGFGAGLIGQQLPQIRVFNGVDNQSSITVQYNGSGGNVLGTSQPVPFAGLSPKDVIISNTNATASVYSGSTALFSGKSGLYQINSKYSLYAGGIPGNYVAIGLNDDVQEGTTAGSLDIRTVHVGAESSPVDVYLLPAGSAVGGSPVFTGVSYGQVTTAGNSAIGVDNNGYSLVAVTSGASYEVVVTTHNSTVPLATATAVLYPTIYYTAVVYDSGKGTGVQILSDRH